MLGNVQFRKTQRMQKKDASIRLLGRDVMLYDEVTLSDIQDFYKGNNLKEFLDHTIQQDGHTVFSLIFTIMAEEESKVRKGKLNKNGALYSTYEDIIRYVSTQDFNINKIVDKHYNNTTLMNTIASGGSNSALKLLEWPDIDPFIGDKWGKNPLHLLIAKGHEHQRAVFDAIMKHSNIKDNINAKTIDGNAPLHIACARRDTYCIEQLLEAGADLSIKNNNGQRALEVLTMDEQDRLELLVSSCLNPKTPSDYGIDVDEYKNEEGKIDKAKLKLRLLAYATVDDKIFNSDPEELKRKIDDLTINSRLNQTNLDNKSLGKSL